MFIEEITKLLLDSQEAEKCMKVETVLPDTLRVTRTDFGMGDTWGGQGSD